MPLAASASFSAWREAGHAGEPRVSVSRSIFPITTAEEQMYFGGRQDGDQIGVIDGTPFDQLKNNLLGPLVAARAQRRSLRIWSAACSSGQEAYSLAMLLLDWLPLHPGYSAKIIGTDIYPFDDVEQASVAVAALDGVI